MGHPEFSRRIPRRTGKTFPIMTPEPPSRADLLARAFIEAGYSAPDERIGILRRDSYWLWNNVGILGLAIGGSDSVKVRRAALTKMRKRDEFNALMFLQAAPLREVTRAMRNFTRRTDAVGHDAAFEEFIEFAVEPTLATLPPEAEAALAQQLAEMSEAAVAMVNATQPAAQQSNRPDDPNTSGQPGSPRA